MISKKTFGLVLIVSSIILVSIFGYIKADFDAQGVFLCEVISTNPNIEMAQCPVHISKIPSLISVGFVISAILLISGIYLVFVKEKIAITNQRTFKKVDISVLSDVEKQIYHILKNNKGSSYQSDLVKQTSLNKVKITRILDKLEHDDGIIERKRRGMANLVVLK